MAGLEYETSPFLFEAGDIFSVPELLNTGDAPPSASQLPGKVINLQWVNSNESEQTKWIGV